MIPPINKQRLGLSLVELLIAMAILGILLATLSAFLISNQRVTSQQITAATLNNDLRLAFLRMSDVISQAQYIFPPDQKLMINGAEYTTGAQALAVLVPAGTTYCPIAKDYCGFAFTIEDRTPFEDQLGANAGTTNLALIETNLRGIEWKKDQLPTAMPTLYTWNTLNRFPITDSVDGVKSDLASFDKLEPSKDTSFDKGFEVNKATITVADYNTYLAASVNSTVSLERRVSSKTLGISRNNFVFSRAIPRGSSTSH
jgi:prepilin-type N-terminal cleavage/methylation domain-containing protein